MDEARLKDIVLAIEKVYEELEAIKKELIEIATETAENN